MNLLGTDSKCMNAIFNVKGADISPNTSVILLGIEIDDKLNFSKHIFEVLDLFTMIVNTHIQNFCLEKIRTYHTSSD